VEHPSDLLSAEVELVEEISPHRLRVHLSGGDLGRFEASGHADQRIHLTLPGPDEEVRSYTVRAWDGEATRLSIDFGLHTAGPGVDWVRAAAPGDVVRLTAGVGWFRPPADLTWCLLVADLAGLPALEHVLERLPENVETIAVVEVPEEADLPSWDRVPTKVAAFTGSGHGQSASRLDGAVAGLTPPEGPGYVWAATEAATSRAIRKHVRGVWGLELARYDITGYWRADEERWMERFVLVEAELDQVWDDALAAGRSEDEASEIYDEALERAGL